MAFTSKSKTFEKEQTVRRSILDAFIEKYQKLFKSKGEYNKQPCELGKTSNKTRKYWHDIILYPFDNDAHFQALQVLICNDADFVSIVHWKEFEKGKCKIHMHIVLYTEEQKTCRQIANILGIEANMVHHSKGKAEMLKYLTHEYEPKCKHKLKYRTKDLYFNTEWIKTVYFNVVSNNASYFHYRINFEEWLQYQGYVSQPCALRWIAENGYQEYYKSYDVNYSLQMHNKKVLEEVDLRTVRKKKAGIVKYDS